MPKPSPFRTPKPGKRDKQSERTMKIQQAFGTAVLFLGSLLQSTIAAPFPFTNLKFNSFEEGKAHVQSLLRSDPNFKVRHAAPHEIPANARRATEETRTEWKPLRIKFDYRLEGRPDEEVTYITEKLMPAVAELLGNVISAKVEEPPFELPSAEWGGLEAPAGIQYDADVVITVGSNTYDENSPDAFWCDDPDTIASALYLIEGEAVNRPVWGAMSFCQVGGSIPFRESLTTAAHEVIHVLGLPPNDLPNDLDEKIVQQQGNSDRVLAVSPRVAEFVRAHFACPELKGAPLEDDAGAGSAAAHWESLLFREDMMGFGARSSTQHTNRRTLSALTLSYLEDTEWYECNYAEAGVISYGLNSGCSLVIGTYDEAIMDSAAGAYLCDVDEAFDLDICTHDASAVGWCHNVTSFDNFIRPDLFGAEFNGFQTECQAVSTGSRCIGYQDPSAYELDTQYYPQCRQMSCSESGKVLVDGQPCETTLGSQGWICPDAYTFCVSPGHLTCVDTLNDCSTNGECKEGTCNCQFGWGGDDCSVPVCTGQCPDGSPCPESGFCGVDAKRVENFERHMQRVYGVEVAPVPEDWTGLVIYGDAASDETQSSRRSLRL